MRPTLEVKSTEIIKLLGKIRKRKRSRITLKFSDCSKKVELEEVSFKVVT